MDVQLLEAEERLEGLPTKVQLFKPAVNKHDRVSGVETSKVIGVFAWIGDV